MFSLTQDEKGKSLAVIYGDGDTDIIPETHVSFQKIMDLLISGTAEDEQIKDLAGVLETVARKLSELSERVSVDGKDVYFDGDPLRGELADVIKAMFTEGNLNFKPLVKFLEKAKTNPSLQSIDDLYRWISKGDLVIDPEGDIIAYKAVRVDENGVSTSIHEGSAFVNGEEFHGHIPNRPGTVVSMARSLVVDDPHIGCSVGLHAGTYSYADQFRGWNSRYTTRIILVKINPRDVVSVPVDEQDRKMRVARYTVLSEIEERLATAFYQPELPVDDEGDEDEDDWNEDDYDYDYDGDLFGEDDEDDEWEDDSDYEDEQEDDEDDSPEPVEDYWGRYGFTTYTPSPVPSVESEENAPEEPQEDPVSDVEDEPESKLPESFRRALDRFKGKTFSKDYSGRPKA